MAALLVIPQVEVLKLNLNNFLEWRSSVQIVDRMQKTWNQILIIMKVVYNGLDIQNMFLSNTVLPQTSMLYSETVMDLPKECFGFLTRIDSIWNLDTVSNS